MMNAARFLSFTAASLVLVSCQTGQQTSAGDSEPYVSNYSSDGGYNPYPGQPGYVQPGSTPTYTQPPAPVEADPYAFNAPTTPEPKVTPKKPTTITKKSTASSSKPKSSSKPTAKKSGGSYKVVKGDTLYGIAKKRGTTVAKIKAANSLSSDIIRPGQSLKIP